MELTNCFAHQSSTGKTVGVLRLLLVVTSFLSRIIINQAFTVIPSTSSVHNTLFWRSSSSSFSSPSASQSSSLSTSSLHLSSRRNDSDDDEDDDDSFDLSDRDWRAFRAQLVKGSTSKDTKSDDGTKDTTSSSSTSSSSSSIIVDDDLDGIGSLFDDDRKDTPMTTENFTPLNPSQWAYDSGNVIEQGAVILGGVEQDFGFGLRQQYFHKAVILVLDHDEHKFTRGIILNRPSDLVLVDEKDEETGMEMKWRVWFGGDVQGLDAPLPEVICLHSISGNEKVDEVSVPVMNDIKWMPFESAKMLVRKGLAQTSDFWVFSGYAGWGPQQLMGELERKSWYMCATDSQTLLKELAKQSALTDPRDAGLDTWELLMNLIGRGETAEESSGDFEDLMLKEWAREKLLSVEAGGNAGTRIQPSDIASGGKIQMAKSVDDLMLDAKAFLTQDKVSKGSLVRAGSTDRSPFLLDNQEFHKSVVLIIADDERLSVGIILNQPSTKAIEMELVDKKTSEKGHLKIPIRFGGMYAIQGQSPLMWMHNSAKLREAGCGSPVGDAKNGIWRCSQSDATGAIEKGIARPSDFLIASGLSVWMKGQQDSDGIQGEIRKGNFEVIPSSKYETVWKKLQNQKDVLTKMNLLQNLSDLNDAWEAGSSSDKAKEEVEEVVTEGIGEGFDEDNDSFVHNSDVRVAKLSDDALRSWIATFILNAPSLGA